MPINFLPDNRITPQNFPEMEKYFMAADSDMDKREAAWDELDNFFRDKNVTADRDYGYLFSWYTEMSWTLLQSFSPDFLADVAMKRMIPMAILLGLDPWKEIIWYLHFNSYGSSDMVAVYGRAKKALLGSSAILGVWKGENFTIAKFVQEMVLVETKPDYSLHMAELRSRLAQIMFPKENWLLEKYARVDVSTAVGNFIDLINFFRGIEGESILYVVDAYVNPEIEVETEEEEPEKNQINKNPVAKAPAPPRPVPPTPKPTPPPRPTIAPSAKPAPVQPIQRVEPKQTVESVASSTIKELVVAKFGANFLSNAGKIGEVMQYLNELSVEKNNPGIAEMIYWDEREEKFKWKA